MAELLKDTHNSFTDLQKPNYNKPFLNNVIESNLVNLQQSVPRESNSTLDQLKTILVTDYLAHRNSLIENDRLKKALESYENQRFISCKAFTVNFSSVRQEMLNAQKIKREDLKTHNITYPYTVKSKRDDFFRTDYFNRNMRMIIIQNGAEHKLLAYLITEKEENPLLIFSSTMKGEVHCGIESRIFDNGLVEVRTGWCAKAKETIEYFNLK